MTPSTPSTMTRTITTLAICTSEHSSAPLVVFPFLMLSHDPLGSSSLSLSSSRHVTHVSLSLIFIYLPLNFNLSFSVFFHSLVLMHPDLHNDLNDPDSVENNLRHSAKGSLDAYDVTFSLTSRVCFAKLTDYIAITLNEKTCLSVCRRRQCPTERSDLLGTERGDLLSKVTRKHRLGLCSTNKKSTLLPNAKQELIDTFEAAYNRRCLLKLGEIVDSQQEELHLARAEEVQQRDHQLLPGQLQQNLELREAHQRSLTEMEELKKFQSSTFDTITRRRVIEDQDTILELSGRIQELQNEINCMSDSKEF